MQLLLLMVFVPLAIGQTDNLVQLATKLGANELVRLVTDAGLADMLANKGSFTVFAPSDEAFERARPLIEHILRNKTLLVDFLDYHMVNGKVMSTQVKNEEVDPSLFSGHSLRFNIYTGRDPSEKLITADGAPIVMADQQASNGVIHLLAKVIFPIPEGSVVDLVTRGPFLSTLLKAVQAADLVSVLQGGPLTVFAPTNEAFDRLPPGTLDKLLANKTALTDVLKYHVVMGTDYAEGLHNGERVPTMEGKDLMVRKMGPDRIVIDNAFVELPDISVTNGVVHIINNVLFPPRLRHYLTEQ